MVTETIEIRGIHRKVLIAYLQEIKEKLTSQEINERWEYHLSDEEFFFLLQSEIPKVYVTLSAENYQLLSCILKEFRLKTWRAGA